MSSSKYVLHGKTKDKSACDMNIHVEESNGAPQFQQVVNFIASAP